MAHLFHNNQKLINRVRRVRGQVEAVERALSHEEGKDCSEVLQLIAACRGSINSLMAEVLESHIRSHVGDPKRKPGSNEAKAIEELIDITRAYLK